MSCQVPNTHAAQHKHTHTHKQTTNHTAYPTVVWFRCGIPRPRHDGGLKLKTTGRKRLPEDDASGDGEA